MIHHAFKLIYLVLVLASLATSHDIVCTILSVTVAINANIVLASRALKKE